MFELTTTPPSDAPRRYVHVIGASVHLDDESPPTDVWPAHFVAVLDGAALYAVDVPDGEDPSDGASVDLRRLFAMVDEPTWIAAGRAAQLVQWARTHHYRGRCATPTVRNDQHISLDCPACGQIANPRIAPAMITLVTRGADGADQEALLARGVGWPDGMYSCLAGFVEPGETLEACVVREINEEVGVTVSDITYWGSQPWPFPHSLMIGFRARYVAGDLVLDEAEIANAKWFRRDELTPQVNPISIARRMIDAWIAEV